MMNAVAALNAVGDQAVNKLEEKAVKNTDKIFSIIKNSAEPVTLKQIQDQTELKPGIVSGTLVHLCKTGLITREKIEKTGGNGPKLQWAYRVLTDSEKKVDSVVE